MKRFTLHRRTPPAAPPSWAYGAWVFAGVQVVVSITFILWGPKISDAWPVMDLDYGELMLDLAKTVVLVNSLVVAGLWIQRRGLSPSTRRHGIFSVCAAICLMMTALAFVNLAQNSVRTCVLVEWRWEQEWEVTGPGFGEYVGYTGQVARPEKAALELPSVHRSPAILVSTETRTCEGMER